MRQSAVLLVVAALGIIGGAALIGVWAIGLAIIFDSVVLGLLALLRDDGATPAVQSLPGTGGTLHEILERARAS